MAASSFKYETCSVQIRLPEDYTQTIQEWSRKHIPDELLWNDAGGTYGRDSRSHITLSLGLRDDRIADYLEIVKPHLGADLATKNITVFETDKFDLILLAVQEDDVLTQMYEALSKVANLKYVRRTFTPHVSIAFITKGKGKQLVKRLSWADRQPLENFDFQMNEIELVTRQGAFVPIQ
jgi:2'-5' RNA ligase